MKVTKRCKDKVAFKYDVNLMGKTTNDVRLKWKSPNDVRIKLNSPNDVK